MISTPDFKDSNRDDQSQWSAIEAALDVALLVMENGGSTFRASQTFQVMLSGFKASEVTSVWHLDSVMVFVQRKGQTTTMMRPIGAAGINLSRVSAAWALARQLEAGAIALPDIPAEIERINALASPYGPSVRVAIAAFTAASFSQLIGGDWGSFALAGVAGGVGQLMRIKLQARHLSTAMVTFLCAILSAFIGSLGLRVGWSQVVPATLIGSVGYMIPGLPLANGFADLISQRTLSAGIERILNAVLLFLMLTIGIAVADAIVP